MKKLIAIAALTLGGCASQGRVNEALGDRMLLAYSISPGEMGTVSEKIYDKAFGFEQKGTPSTRELVLRVIQYDLDADGFAAYRAQLVKNGVLRKEDRDNDSVILGTEVLNSALGVCLIVVLKVGSLVKDSAGRPYFIMTPRIYEANVRHEVRHCTGDVHDVDNVWAS